MIIEDYVSFETAKLLKEKGFDEDCAALYDLRNGEFREKQTGYVFNNSQWESYITAPTLQMARKWLRNEKDIAIEIELGTGGKDCWVSNVIEDYKTENAILVKVFVEFSYEQACEVAIKYCLENLI